MLASLLMQELESRHIKQRSENEAQLNSLSTDSDSETSNRPDADGGSSSGEEFIVSAEDRVQQHTSATPSGRTKPTNLVNGARSGFRMHLATISAACTSWEVTRHVYTTSSCWIERQFHAHKTYQTQPQ